jgi:hypothetical protein
MHSARTTNQDSINAPMSIPAITSRKEIIAASLYRRGVGGSNPPLAPALILSNPEQANHNEKTEEQSYRNIQPCVIKPDSENGDDQSRQHTSLGQF